MKIKNIFKAFAALLAIGVMSSCQNSFDDPGLVVPVATRQANTTLAEFKEAFRDAPDQLCPYKDEATKTPYIVKGRVISSDATGNIYKAMYIQDETGALLFSINRAALYEYFHIGQEIVVELTGMWVGKYNNMLQIGWLDYNSNKDLVEMGRMDFNLFKQHLELNGLPETELTYIDPDGARPDEGIYCVVENIDAIPKVPADPGFYNMQGQLVEFRNVSFVDGGELTFSKYQSSGENRNIMQEGNSAELTVRTSGYALFYNEKLPTGKGTVRGILSYYSDNPDYKGNDQKELTGWQLLIRSMDDVMFDDKGSKEKPYSVKEAIGLAGQGRNGWVKGYIVGSVKAGVSTVGSNDDIIFGGDAELDNNIVLATEPTVKDWTECVSVQLPQGSDLRKYANLIDNPSVYGQEISVSGSISFYLGMAGIESDGLSSSFEIPGAGEDNPPVNPATGDGTKENPYTVEQIMSSTQNQEDVWVEGYVVGYIPDVKFEEAVYGNTPTEGSENYLKGTNLLLSSAPAGEASDVNSIPVGLSTSVRSVLGISKNPAIYGKRVKIKGSLESYFRQRGIKNVSEYVILDGEGGGETPEPTPTPTPTPGEGSGDGTEANPYDIAYVMGTAEDQTGVWVVGYVAGYVPGLSWEEAVFSTVATEGSTNYSSGTNCVLSSTAPSSATLDNSIPCGLSTTGDVRATIAVGKNPGIFGKKVALKGDITRYFKMRGLKNVSEFKILD